MLLIKSAQLNEDEFIRQVLERDIRTIFRAQYLIVSKNVYLRGKTLAVKKRRGATIGSRSGALEQALAEPSFAIRSEGEQFIAAAEYPLHIRFLDMKRKGNWQIYNRQVWGILYNNALQDIRFKYGEDIHDRVGEALHEAFG